jgi:hypothetical protein
MANFDVKRVTPLEWAGIGAGALTFIASFLPWYSVSYEGGGLSLDIGISANAWEFALSLLAVLMLIAAGVLVLLPHLGTQVPNLAIIWLALAGLAFVFILIRWLTFPGDEGVPGVSAGAGFGLFVGLILALASGAGAFLTFRSSSRTNV